MLALLPDVAACAVAALLESDDLERLRCVCRDTASDPLLRDPRPRTLVLPPTNDAAARRLLCGLSRGRDDSSIGRLTSITAIQLMTVRHAELLVESPMRELVATVRIKPIESSDNETATAICEALQRLPRLLRLETTNSVLHRVDALARIPQLRELDFTNTKLSVVSALSSLANLQKLVLDEPTVSGLSCISDLTELRELRILDRSMQGANGRGNRGGRYVKVHVPPLHGLTKLQRLELESCSIESVADLVGIASGLLTLKLTNVRVRQQNTVLDDATGFRVNVDEPELLMRLAKLEQIRLFDSVSVMGVTDEGAVDSLAKIRSLRSIQHPIESNLAGLAPLVHLEELELHLCTTYMDRGRELEDFSVLLQLPQLKKLKIRHNGHVAWPMPVYIPSHEYENIKREARAFTDVLEQLTALESIHYEGFIDYADVLPRLTQLKELTLSRITPHITSFDWIQSLRRLLSLTITTDSKKCDLASIGTLSQLEALSLTDVQLHCDGHCPFAFLGTLVNLRKLELQGGHVHDLAGLVNLQRLTTLRIQSTCKEVKTMNVDSLLELKQLRELDIFDVFFDDLTPLLHLRSLRSVLISDSADCTPLVACEHPKLLRVSHRGRNCLWDGPHPTLADEHQHVSYSTNPSAYSPAYYRQRSYHCGDKWRWDRRLFVFETRATCHACVEDASRECPTSQFPHKSKSPDARRTSSIERLNVGRARDLVAGRTPWPFPKKPKSSETTLFVGNSPPSRFPPLRQYNGRLPARSNASAVDARHGPCACV